MSLLFSAGHAHADQYPIGMVWDEALIVRQRRNADEVTRATLLQMAVSGVVSKKANKDFQKHIKQLLEE